MTGSAWRSYMRVRAIMHQRYPLAFPKKTCRPLVVGVRHHLMAPETLATLEVSRGAMRQFLASWTRRRRYLRAVAAGGNRVDLGGVDVITILPVHQRYAQLELADRCPGVAAANDRRPVRRRSGACGKAA